MNATRNVAILLFPDVELLDFAGPFEVCSVASRWFEPSAFRTYTVAEKPGPILAKNGLSVNPHHLLSECPPPLHRAAPLGDVLVSVTGDAVIVLQDWHKVHFGSAWRLVLSTLFGIPFGLLLLTAVPGPVVKAVLAVVIITFSAYCLVKRTPLELHDDRLAWLFGLGAGVLGGAYGMNGPPLVVYGTLRRWSAEHFRATLQGYFLPASLVVMAGYWLAGLWVPRQ
jgi:uncharacterized membrane protein YfcA